MIGYLLNAIKIKLTYNFIIRLLYRDQPSDRIICKIYRQWHASDATIFS